MKRILNEDIKKVLIYIITIILCVNGTCYAQRMLKAKDIEFYATNANFKAANVGDAIDSLYNEAQKEQKYSLEEKVVGTWIDGKPIYRKCYDLGSKTGSDFYFIIPDLGPHVIDTLVDSKIITKDSSGGNYVNLETWINNVNYHNDWLMSENASWASTENPNHVRIHHMSASSGTFSFIAILEYTKKSD